MPESDVVRRVARAQRLCHIVANKLTLPLTVLRELRDGRAVEPRVIAKAVEELESLIASLDAQRRPFGRG